MTETKREWYVIGRGKAGWHATGKNVSSSGGQLNPYTYCSGASCPGYLAGAVEGCLVYDAQDADTAAFVRHVLSGPMVDPTLGDYEDDKFTDADRKALDRMMPGLEGGFKTIAALAQSPTYGGMDKVGVGIYEALLAKIPGIKIGRVKNGVIEWR